MQPHRDSELLFNTDYNFVPFQITMLTMYVFNLEKICHETLVFLMLHVSLVLLLGC